MLVVACLTSYSPHVVSYLMPTCLLSLIGVFVRISSCCCKSWQNGVYNCLNNCLYGLGSTLILNIMHSISFFSRFVFDEFIAKGGKYGHKVG
jgi:hypothetical protein